MLIFGRPYQNTVVKFMTKSLVEFLNTLALKRNENPYLMGPPLWPESAELAFFLWVALGQGSGSGDVVIWGKHD